MECIDLSEQYRIKMDTIKKFTLMDDAFMTQVFSENIEATELLLHVILKRSDLKVVRAKTQQTVANLFGRGARLDIYALDGEGRQYDIEVQQKDDGALPERARLNSALLDSRLTDSGKKFEDMPETYVIFITANDVLGGDIPLYTIERVVLENNKMFGDRAHIVYVNGRYRGKDDLGKLMHDLNCKDHRDMYFKILADGVKHYKEDPEGVLEMSEAMERLVVMREETAILKERKDFANVLWDMGIHDVDEIAEKVKLTVEQVLEAVMTDTFEQN